MAAEGNASSQRAENCRGDRVFPDNGGPELFGVVEQGTKVRDYSTVMATGDARAASSSRLADESFAGETVVCVDPNGQRTLVRIEIGRPYAVSAQQARCPVRMRGLYDDLGFVAGGSTLQALSLALLLVGNLLTRFVQRGGRVLVHELEGGDGDGDQDFPFEAYFAPVDGAVLEDAALRSVLAVHSALVGRITPQMRAVSFEVTDHEVVLWVYHEGTPSREPHAGLDVELIRAAFLGKPRVRVQLEQVSGPLLQVRGTLVFALKDEPFVEAVA